MTGDSQDDTNRTTPAEGNSVETDAARVGGWGTGPPAPSPEKIIIVSSDHDHHPRNRRVVARGKPRGEADEGLIIQALLMIAKDLEQRDMPD